MSSFEAAAKPRHRSFWIPVICGAVILTIGVGARQSFGIFQKPIAADLRVGRELWSFANALAMLLMGLFSPFVGNVADRFGSTRTVAAGGVLYVIGMFMIAFATESVLLTLGNVLCGVGMAAARFGPIFSAINRNAPPGKRSPRIKDGPPIDAGIGFGGEAPGQLRVIHQLHVAGRDVNERVPVTSARFEQRDTCVGVLAQPVGQYAPRRTCADDHVVRLHAALLRAF